MKMTFAAIGLLGFAIGDARGAETETRPSEDSAPRTRVFPKRQPKIDDVLARPYDATVPFGSSGDRLWATSPQGFGFDDGVHVVFVNDFVPFRLTIAGFKPGEATSYPSHVRVKGEPGNELTARASFTYRTDGVNRPLVKPFEPGKRWTCWNSKSRKDWYEVRWGEPAKVSGVAIYFFDDAPTGGACRAPETLTIWAWVDGDWSQVSDQKNDRGAPSSGVNQFTFSELTTDRLRFEIRNRGRDFYTGIYGVDPFLTMEAARSSALDVTVDKYITNDDRVRVDVFVRNKNTASATLQLTTELPWLSAEPGRRLPFTMKPDTSRLCYSDIDIAGGKFLVAFTATSPDGILRGTPVDSGLCETTYWTVEVPPGGSRKINLGLSLGDPVDQAKARRQAQPRDLDSADLTTTDFAKMALTHVEQFHAWFDVNIATFDCSDPAVTKMFWHRAYLLKKNFMNPNWGRLTHRCCAEGRWRADWYSNVISYGAGHQIREARWFADPSYAWGQLATWAENPKKDGVFPSHVKPDGPQQSQYTDWISSTALDVMAVHPDTAALTKHFEPLARNARAWIDVFDRDGDFLPVVDSHWWTGMEWQPSFFAFNGFLPDEGDPKEADLERVDLAAYTYGDVKNMAACARLLGNVDEGKSLDALAVKIQTAVETKLWNPAWKFFLSNRWNDDAPALVKEVIGVYPFYFGLPTPGKGFEAAWASIVNPAEFWGPWPVRSCSRECPAYCPGRGWSAGRDLKSGCMWNGPTWPHANSIVLTAMARTLRDYPPCDLTRQHLFGLFNSFTKAQFKDGDLSKPWTGEFYHADTGAWMTDEHDYNHSTYLDILIPELCGLRPRNDGVLEVDPLLPSVKDGGWSHFLLDGQRYRGHDITIVWDAPDGKRVYEGVDEGLTVFVDGAKRAHRPDLGRLTLPLE